MEKTYFHIDVNSAFLSWEASHRMAKGDSFDLRSVPSIVGGDPKKRKGIVLAKSHPAKKFGILTGEPIASALKKCKTLIIVPPNYGLYERSSQYLHDLLYSHTPELESFSIDEFFLAFTHLKNPLEKAMEIKEEIKKSLGYTVNIGISVNKLLAKMAGEFEKPDKIHTLFPWEIEKKMWPLPVRELFMVGRRTEKKLQAMGIFTVKELANTPVEYLEKNLKSYGRLLFNYANGREYSSIGHYSAENAKSVGNSTTLKRDIRDWSTLSLYLLGLSEMTSQRLRRICGRAYVISVHYKDYEFVSYERQQKLYTPTASTTEIYEKACELFLQLWKREPVRAIGLRLSELTSEDHIPLSLFTKQSFEKQEKLDKTIDAIRSKYGNGAVQRASFLGSPVKPLIGGIGDEQLDLKMKSQL